VVGVGEEAAAESCCFVEYLGEEMVHHLEAAVAEAMAHSNWQDVEVG
jgi:hypothetical protein